MSNKDRYFYEIKSGFSAKNKIRIYIRLFILTLQH